MAVSVKAILGFDGRAFDAGIKKARTSLNSLAKGALKSQVAQTLSVGYISSQLKQVSDFANQVQKLAPALGMTTDELQKWEYVFARAGLELDDVADAFATLADRTEDALVGTESMIEDFRLIGITVDQLRGKNPVQLFELFADGVKKTTDTNRALTAIVRNLGDDLGRKLAPMLMLGADGMAELREEAEKLGIVLDATNLDEAAEAVKQMKIHTMQMRSYWASIYGWIAKTLTTLKDGIDLLNIFDYQKATANYSYQHPAAPLSDGVFDFVTDSFRNVSGQLRVMEGVFNDKMLKIGQRKMAEGEVKTKDPITTRINESVNALIELKGAREAYNKKVDDHNFKQLSHEEKITTLLKQREEIQKRMRSATDKEYFNLAGQSLDLLTQAQALSAAKAKSANVRSQGLTASQSVGAFVSRSNPLIGIARKQLITQEQMRDALLNPQHNPVNNPHGTAGMLS